MKKILIPVSAIFIAGFSKAQLTNTENYVYSKTYLDYNGATATKVSETVQYFDGLGRPKQVVNVKASPQGKDVVSHIEYDGFGRQVKDYLPVPQSGTMNGAIVPNPLANATQTTLYGSEKIYTEKILENSPLDRVFEQKQVGNAWANKPVKFEYDANSVADAVKKYITTTTWVSGATNSVLTQTANYGLAQLYKNTVTDEDGNKSIEFKNGEGQTVLVRKMLNDGKSADTYYVYNEYNQLAYVIPPLASNSALSSAVLDNLCYQYKYDGRNRLVEKKLPGKGWEYMVYDKQDCLVATKDSQNPWLFTKYDKFGRAIYTGLADLGSRNKAQTNLDNLSGTAAPNNEAKSTSSFNHSGMDIYYSNSAFPTNIIKILSVNYYDTYPTGTPAIPVEILGQPVLSEDSQNSNISTKSLPTASYVKNIENDYWMMNYTWYDTKGRAIGSHSINHLGGFTKTESELDFAGVVKEINTYHSRDTQNTQVTINENFTYDSQNRLLTHTHQVDGNPVEVLAENRYNELGQLINKRIGSNLQNVEYDYNIRGWMTGINKKKLTPNGMDGRLFAYDIRYENPTSPGVSPAKFNGNISEVNWMVSSNQNHKRYAYNYDQLNRLTAATFLNPNSTTPLNHMNDEIIDYDLNGNIIYLKRNAAPFAGTTPDMIDELIYAYNGNQLISIDDTSNNPTGYEGGGGTMQYDTNGNMISMPDKQINQIGYNFLNLPNALNIENNKKKLFHLYRADGSKLKKIFNYLKDDGNTFTSVTEYLDGFQHLTTMGTKPNELDPMEYAYEQEAFLEQILEEQPIAALQFFPTAEGFYDYGNNQYIYQYKDHLGNVRVSYKKGQDGLAEITDQNDYYPFGMNIPREGKAIVGVASLYNYKYNGKELQETGMYDYGARFYMPDNGRWGVVDPLSDATFQPYNYANNNPISFNDPTGMIGERSNNYIASTDVVRNTNGSYTVVGAYDDGDTNIYVVNNEKDKKRTGEVIGETMRPCDFCSSNDKTGGFNKFDKKISGVTFNLNNLTVSGTAKDKSGRSAELEDMDAASLLEWIKQYYMNTINGNMPGTPYGWLQVLRELSANDAILDVKASMGLSPYTAIGNGKNAKGKPIITTLRAMGNMGFGANMLLAKPPIVGKNFWYGAIMNQAGQYNQSQNGGNGYNAHYPYFGEHSYSGGYIYFGYFRQFYKK